MDDDEIPEPKPEPEDARYEGEVNEIGQPHGQGIEYSGDGSVSFEGEFKNGEYISAIPSQYWVPWKEGPWTYWNESGVIY